MSLEKQVCSLEYAKRLKEIDVEQGSLFYHLIGGICARSECLPLLGDDWCSAFTAQELLNKVNGCFFHIGRDDNLLWLYYSPEHGTDNSYHFSGPNLADLVAQMLIAQYTENQQLN